MKRARRQAGIRGAGHAQGVRPSSYWILSPVWDSLLILLSPLLILVVYLVSLRLGAIGTFVLAGTILSMGHYLPGMLRAYGDPELFQRFRLRFTIVPLALIVLCAGAARVNLQALVFIGMCWGSWHWMKQIYGFARIYDARAGAIDPTTSGLDSAMCLVWFVWVGAVFNSTAAGHLAQLYASGVSLVPEVAFTIFRIFWTALTVLVSALFVVHAIQRRRAGKPGNPLKFVMIAGSIAWFGFSASKIVEAPMASWVLFEAFHDIQYLAIVWAFNRRRTQREPAPDRLMRFLFRPHAGLVLLYVGLCLAFGSYEQLAFSVVNGEAAARIAFSFVTAMGFYHYYLDGFIWKIREAPTQRSLGIDSATPVRSARPTRLALQSGMLRHAALWGLLGLVLGGLVAVEYSGRTLPAGVDIQRNLAAAFPRDPHFPLQVCGLENERGRYAEAKRWCQRALEMRPSWAFARKVMAVSVNGQARRDGLP